MILNPDNLNNYTKLIWMLIFFTASALIAGVISHYYSWGLNSRLRAKLINIINENPAMTTDIG